MNISLSLSHHELTILDRVGPKQYGGVAVRSIQQDENDDVPKIRRALGRLRLAGLGPA